MKRWATSGAAVCVMLSVSPADGQITSDSLRTAINGIMAGVAADTAPGCAVGVSRAGNVLFTGGYGLANMEFGVGMSPRAVVPVASISKQVSHRQLNLSRVGRGLLRPRPPTAARIVP